MNWNADENNAGGTEQQSADNNQATTNTTEAQPMNGNTATDQTSSSTNAAPPIEERRPRRRGFAAMDRDRVREIASKGGKAAHAAGTAHQFSSDEARVAGRKGGMAPHVRRGGVRRRPNESGTSVGPTGSNAETGEQDGSNR